MSVKFQVTLPQPLLADLKRVAEVERVSVAEFIRQTMSDRLRRHGRGPKGDPFDAITGLVDSEETDLSKQIDEILYR